MRTVLITGVAGVGKSTLSRLIAHELDLRHYDFADLMLTAAPHINGKDGLETLDWPTRQRIYTTVDVLLDEWFGPTNTSREHVLMENHLSVLQRDIVVTFPSGSWRRYQPAGIIDVTADPHTIQRRRARDSHRRRRTVTTADIARQQDTNAHQARVITEHLAIPLLTLENTSLAYTVEEARVWVKELLP